MPTIAEVRQQIQAYPYRYIFWTQKEIRALPKILDEGEPIKALTSGFNNGSTWLAVCTDRRIFFVNRGMFWGFEQVQMPLDRVQSIDYQFTFFFGSIKLFDGVNVFVLNMVSKRSIMPFVKVTQEAMYESSHGHARGAQVVAAAPVMAAAPVAAAGHADVATQLAKLVELKEKGYLTDQEFQDQKHKILSS